MDKMLEVEYNLQRQVLELKDMLASCKKDYKNLKWRFEELESSSIALILDKNSLGKVNKELLKENWYLSTALEAASELVAHLETEK